MHFNPLQFCSSMSLLGFPVFCLRSSIVLSRFCDILVNSMTIWSVLKLPKNAWPSPFKNHYNNFYWTTILDKINGTSGPPLPPFQWCQNGALLLLCAFIIALGGMGDNCSILFCPRLSEDHTGVTRSYLCYADHIWSVVARLITKGKER